MKNEKTPVAVFAFNRAEQLQFVLKRLSLADEVLDRDIIVYLDGDRSEKDVPKTSAVLRVVEQFKRNELPNIEIRKREKNYGCKKNISGAITDILAKYERIIVVEDDVLVSKYFLRYMDEALEFYKDDMRIWGINGHQCPYMRIPKSYAHDVYLSPRNLCTGWGTWRNRWEGVDFAVKDWPEFVGVKENYERVMEAGWDIKYMLDLYCAGRLTSWALPCTYHMIKNGLFMIEPKYAQTKNIGFGVESIHCESSNMAWSRQKYYNHLPRLVEGILPDPLVLRKFRYVYQDPRILHRVVRKLYRMWCGLLPLNNEPIQL